MSEKVIRKYCSSCFFLISEYFLPFGFGRTLVNSFTIVYVTVYKRKINIFPGLAKTLTRRKIPRLFDVLFSIRVIGFFHVRFLLNITPNNLIWSTRHIRVLFIFNARKTNGILSFCLTLQNNLKLFLSAFRNNLLLLNQ